MFPFRREIFNQLDRDREQISRVRRLSGEDVDLFALDKPSWRLSNDLVQEGGEWTHSASSLLLHTFRAFAPSVVAFGGGSSAGGTVV